MHRYGSHQGEVKGPPHYPAPVKTFGVFYASIRKQEGVLGVGKREQQDVWESKIVKIVNVTLDL